MHAIEANAFEGIAATVMVIPAGTAAEAYCSSHSDCVFVEEGQN